MRVSKYLYIRVLYALSTLAARIWQSGQNAELQRGVASVACNNKSPESTTEAAVYAPHSPSTIPDARLDARLQLQLQLLLLLLA